MPDRWNDLMRFLKAKRLPRVTRVVGGPIRRAYLNPKRVRVVKGRDA